MNDTHYPPFWKERLLEVIGGHRADSESLRLLDAWSKAEGGTARWNPLNTTLSIFGATAYNAVGVKNYKRPIDGICATAMTLDNGYYPWILGGLQSNTKAHEVVRLHSFEFTKWGTNPDNIARILSEIR